MVWSTVFARSVLPAWHLAALRGSIHDSEVWTWLVVSFHTTHRHMISFSTLLLSYATVNVNDP